MKKEDVNRFSLAEKFLIFVVFAVSLAFLVYSFTPDKFIHQMVICSAIFIVFALVSKIPKPFSGIVTLLVLAGFIGFSVYQESIAQVAMTVAFSITVVSHFFINKDTLGNNAFVLFKSLSISAAIGLGVYFLYAFVLFPAISPINVIVLNLFLVLQYFIFFFSHQSISKSLFDKKFGFGKLKPALITTTVVLFTSFMLTSVAGIVFVNQIYEMLPGDVSSMEVPSYDEMISHDIKNTTISLVVKEIYDDTNELLNYQMPVAEEWNEKLVIFYSGRIFDDVGDYISALTRVQRNYEGMNNALQAVSLEYEWIMRNLGGSEFYDGTKTITQHNEKLRENIDTLSPMMDKREEAYLDLIETELLNLSDPTLAEKSAIKTAKQLELYKELIAIYQRYINGVRDYSELIEKFDIQTQNEIEETMRLKIIETLMATHIDGNCPDCEINITQAPRFDSDAGMTVSIIR